MNAWAERGAFIIKTIKGLLRFLSMRTLSRFFLFWLWLFSTGCTLSRNKPASEQVICPPFKDAPSTTALILEQRPQKTWTLSRRNFPGKKADFVQVLKDESLVAFTADGAIYKSTDTAPWQKREFSTLAGEEIQKVYADASDRLWAVSYSSGSVRTGSIHRSDDGGNTWEKRYSEKHQTLGDLEFSGPDEIWATGARDYDMTTHLLIHSVDDGRSWQDFSSALRVALQEEEPAGLLAFVKRAGPSRMLLLTAEGRLLEMKMPDKTVRKISSFPLSENNDHAGMKRFGEKTLIFGGRDNLHGFGGFLISLSDDCVWQRYSPAVSVRDALPLSEKEILVCGSLRTDEAAAAEKNASSIIRRKREGVILYSADSGITWETVCRSSASSSYNSLAAGSNNRVYAVGDAGEIIILSRS